MTILITGGAGFLGSHLTEALMADHTVVIVDNFETGRKDNIPAHTNVKIYDCDIATDNNFKALRDVFFSYKPEVVIHAAASYNDPNDWQKDIRTNVAGTANIIKLCEANNVKKLIYFQTSLCYGLHPVDSPLRIDSEVKPEGNTYAITKTAGENLIMLGTVPYVSFRLANVMGPRNLSGPVPTFYQRLKGDKPCFVMDTRRDFIYVRDLVKVVVRAIMGEGEVNRVYHISTGQDYSIKDMYNAVTTAMGLKDLPDVEVRTPHEDDAPTLLIDPSETESAFPGWKAKVCLDEAVTAAVEWYDTHMFGETFTHLKDVKGD